MDLWAGAYLGVSMFGAWSLHDPLRILENMPMTPTFRVISDPIFTGS